MAKIYYYFKISSKLLEINLLGIKSLENQILFLLNQNNFLQHQIDQSNQITFKILNSKTQLEQKSKYNDKNPRVKAVKENICKLPKDIKKSPKKKKAITERKSIFIVGDSMTKDFAEGGILEDHNAKTRTEPGFTTEDIEDLIESILRRNPDAIIIHTETNDIMNDKPMGKKIKKVVQLIEEASPDIKIIKSGLKN